MTRIARGVWLALAFFTLIPNSAMAVDSCAQCLANVVALCAGRATEGSGESCFERRAGHCFESERCFVQADSDSLSYRCAEQKLCRERNQHRILASAAALRRCGDDTACRDRAEREEQDAADEFQRCFDQRIGPQDCRDPLAFFER